MTGVKKKICKNARCNIFDFWGHVIFWKATLATPGAISNQGTYLKQAMQWRQYVNPYDQIWRLDNLRLDNLEVKDLVRSCMHETREYPVTEIFLNQNLIGIFYSRVLIF